MRPLQIQIIAIPNGKNIISNCSIPCHLFEKECSSLCDQFSKLSESLLDSYSA